MLAFGFFMGELINFISIDRFNWAEKSIEFCGDDAKAREKMCIGKRSWKMIFYCSISMRMMARSEKQIERMEHWVGQKIIHWIIAFPNPWDRTVEWMFCGGFKIAFLHCLPRPFVRRSFSWYLCCWCNRLGIFICVGFAKSLNAIGEIFPEILSVTEIRFLFDGVRRDE